MRSTTRTAGALALLACLAALLASCSFTMKAMVTDTEPPAAHSRGIAVGVGSFTNALGFKDSTQIGWNTRLDRPVTSVVRELVSSELVRAGYSVGDGPYEVSGVVSSFAFGHLGQKPKTIISFRVTTRDGRPVSERTYTRTTGFESLLDEKQRLQTVRQCIRLFVDDLPSFISASPAPAALSAPSALTAGTGTTASGATVDTLTRPGSGQRWALVVGISRYADSRIPALRYADADAAALHEWLVSPEGGRYAPANVRLLLNGSATGTAIRSSLFTWLQSALAEDMVLVFFAGHGSSDAPGSRGNLFLLPYDVRYDDIAGTAFPMWDLRTALDRFIRAKRVVVLADACHSAGVGEGFDVAMRAGRDLEVSPLVNGFQSLSEVSEGVCVLTASDAAQYSQEAAEWGGGHGVFTYFFLEGLRGAADYDKNGTISLGEMIPYLSQSVRRATRNAQSPTVAGRFDPALTFGQ